MAKLLPYSADSLRGPLEGGVLKVGNLLLEYGGRFLLSGTLVTQLGMELASLGLKICNCTVRFVAGLGEVALKLCDHAMGRVQLRLNQLFPRGGIVGKSKDLAFVHRGGQVAQLVKDSLRIVLNTCRTMVLVARVEELSKRLFPPNKSAPLRSGSYLRGVASRIEMHEESFPRPCLADFLKSSEVDSCDV